MTAPDDLARTLAELTREPYRLADLICNTRHPETRETMTGFIVGAVFVASCADCKHLASVVSRRDADLRTRIEALMGGLARLVDEAPFMSWEGKHGATVLRAVPAGQLRLTLARGLDADTHEVAP